MKLILFSTLLTILITIIQLQVGLQSYEVLTLKNQGQNQHKATQVHPNYRNTIDNGLYEGGVSGHFVFLLLLPHFLTLGLCLHQSMSHNTVSCILQLVPCTSVENLGFFQGNLIFSKGWTAFFPLRTFQDRTFVGILDVLFCVVFLHFFGKKLKSNKTFLVIQIMQLLI